MSDLKFSPLNDFHLEHGARMVPFAGWSMPVQYSSIIDEHLATRGYAGLFDVSHMGQLLVQGSGAEAFLDWLLTNRIAGIAEGQAVYSPMCREDGGVVDDVIAMRLGAKRFLVVVNASNQAKDFEWVQEQSANFDCEVSDVSEQYALLALQGPKAQDILQRTLNPLHAGANSTSTDYAVGAGAKPGGSTSQLHLLKRFHFWQDVIANIPVIICRTGYTGEDGFEIFCPPERAADVAEEIMEVGVPIGLLPCGLGARDSLRLEAGYPLYGNELSDTLTPLHAALDWTVKLKKESFCGKATLEKLANGRLMQKLLYFHLDGRRIARAGTPVLCNGSECGRVISGAHSPVLERPIGSALVDISAHGGELTVDLRGNVMRLNVAKPPLHLLKV